MDAVEWLAREAHQEFKNRAASLEDVLRYIAVSYKAGELTKGGPGSGNFGHEGRPGEVGGSGGAGEGGAAGAEDTNRSTVGGTGTTETGYASIRERESEIRSQSYESARIVGADGTVVLDKDGGEHTIDFSAKEVRGMKDTVLTHNHPNGRSFTETDVQLAMRANMAEIRAVSKDHIYVLRRPAKGWPSTARFSKLSSRVTGEVSETIWGQLRSRAITGEQADDQHWDLLWKSMAEEMGGEYLSLSEPTP